MPNHRQGHSMDNWCEGGGNKVGEIGIVVALERERLQDSIMDNTDRFPEGLGDKCRLLIGHTLDIRILLGVPLFLYEVSMSRILGV